MSQILAQILPNNVEPKRERKAIIHGPPELSEIDDLFESLGGIRDLTLVNEQPRVEFSAADTVHNLVKGNIDVLNSVAENPEEQGRRCQLPRSGNFLSLQLIKR